MPAVAERLMSAEEFAALPNPPDGSRQELVKGVIQTMPPVQGRHGYVAAKITRKVGNFVDDNRLGWVVVESGVILERDPDTVRGPDVSFYSIDRHPEPPDRYFEIPPDLAVEVLSPDDRRSKVREKIREYVSKGVKVVWLVDPEQKIVTVYTGSLRGVEYDETDSPDGGDVLPGFTCKVGDFFG
jgi:Uma2 family endonuclease